MQSASTQLTKFCSKVRFEPNNSARVFAVYGFSRAEGQEEYVVRPVGPELRSVQCAHRSRVRRKVTAAFTILAAEN
jgi:hypothetical protein